MVPDPLDVAKIANIFLVPNSILVAALGVARTEPLKTGVSILGFVVSGLWLVCGMDAIGNSVREQVLAWLPTLFIGCWLLAGIVHARLWRKISGRCTVTLDSDVGAMFPDEGTANAGGALGCQSS